MSKEPIGDDMEIFTAKAYIYESVKYVQIPPWVIESLKLEHGDQVEIVMRKIVEE